MKHVKTCGKYDGKPPTIKTLGFGNITKFTPSCLYRLWDLKNSESFPLYLLFFGKKIFNNFKVRLASLRWSIWQRQQRWRQFWSNCYVLLQLLCRSKTFLGSCSGIKSCGRPTAWLNFAYNFWNKYILKYYPLLAQFPLIFKWYNNSDLYPKPTAYLSTYIYW